jgi:hypothetical protein
MAKTNWNNLLTVISCVAVRDEVGRRVLEREVEERTMARVVNASR